MNAKPGRNISCLHGSITKSGSIVWKTALMRSWLGSHCVLRSCYVDTLPLVQLLERAQTIIRESSVTEKMVITGAQSTTRTKRRRTCYTCQGYSAKECKRKRASMHFYRCKHVSGNQAGDKTSASVHSRKGWRRRCLSVMYISTDHCVRFSLIEILPGP